MTNDPDWFARDQESKRAAYTRGFVFGAIVGAIVMAMTLPAVWLIVIR